MRQQSQISSQPQNDSEHHYEIVTSMMMMMNTQNYSKLNYVGKLMSDYDELFLNYEEGQLVIDYEMGHVHCHPSDLPLLLPQHHPHAQGHQGAQV